MFYNEIRGGRRGDERKLKKQMAFNKKNESQGLAVKMVLYGICPPSH